MSWKDLGFQRSNQNRREVPGCPRPGILASVMKVALLCGGDGRERVLYKSGAFFLWLTHFSRGVGNLCKQKDVDVDESGVD